MFFHAFNVACLLLALATPDIAQAQASPVTSQPSDLILLKASDFAVLDIEPLMLKAQPHTQIVEKWVADGEEGNHHAMTLAALSMLRGGVETKWDWKFGHTLLMRAAVAGNVRARVELARMIDYAVPPERRAMVKGWLEDAAAAKFPMAERIYAEWLIEGSNDTPKDQVRGLEMMRAAAGRGVTDAMLYLATLQPDNGSYRSYSFLGFGDVPFYHSDPLKLPKLSESEITKWMRAAADAGDRRGKFGMAVLHYHGWGVPKNKEMEVNWHRLAAEGKHGFGKYDFARRLMKGDGIVEDRSKGFALLRELYPIPVYVDQNVTELLTDAEWDAWLIADNGQRPNYGRHYSGRAITASYQGSRLAIPWLKIPANAGDAESMFLLGQLYDRGYYGNPNDKSAQDPALAIYWYEKAILNGWDGALVFLGQFYMSGPAAYRDEIKAIALFERARTSKDKVVREWATDNIAKLKQRQIIRAERERIELANAREEARFQAERARIERANAAEAAAAWQRVQAENQLQTRAWQFYRPNFTGSPTLDAMESKRAWQAAEASVRFYDWCALNNCAAISARIAARDRGEIEAEAAARDRRRAEEAEQRSRDAAERAERAAALARDSADQKKKDEAAKAKAEADKAAAEAEAARREAEAAAKREAEEAAALAAKEEADRIAREAEERKRREREEKEARDRAEAARRISWLEGVVACPLKADNRLFGAIACFGPFQNPFMDPVKGALSDVRLGCGGGDPWLIGDFSGYRVWGCGFGINPVLSSQWNHVDVPNKLGISVPRRGIFSCHPDQREVCYTR